MLKLFYIAPLLRVPFVRSEVPRITGDSPSAIDFLEAGDLFEPLADYLVGLKFDIWHLRAQLNQHINETKTTKIGEAKEETETKEEIKEETKEETTEKSVWPPAIIESLLLCATMYFGQSNRLLLQLDI